MNWLGSYYFEVTVAGREENEVEDQQTADAILSINYRDKVGRKLSFCPDLYLLLQDGNIKTLRGRTQQLRIKKKGEGVSKLMMIN